MKKATIIIIPVIIVGIIIIAITYMNNWPLRFSRELDKFFGENNWKYVSSKTKESKMFEIHKTDKKTGITNKRPGHYKNWEINYKGKNWTISNHTYKINHNKYWYFSKKRKTAKEALILELMNISEEIVVEKLKEEIIKDLYKEKEVECFDIDLMYNGGNPNPEFYNKLYKQDWFTASKVTVKDYLQTDLYDFYLYIKIFDYKLEKLTEEEKQNLLKTREKLEQRLIEEYKDNASFEIYFQKENKSKYKDGKKEE